MSEKIRELTIDGYGPYRVSNVRGIIDPGKFEGEFPHAVRDHDYTGGQANADFGDTSEFGVYCWQVGHRYYKEDDQGFVTEIGAADYALLEQRWGAWGADQEDDE